MNIDDKTLPPEILFDRISQFVTESRELVKAGAMMEITGLEEKVQMMCEMVLSLSQEQRLMYADKLQDMMMDIHKLGEEMMALRDTMGDEIRSLSKMKQATVAYRIVDASDDYGKKDGNK